MPTSIQQNVSLKPYTTLDIGGKAEYFSVIDTISALDEVVKWAKKEELPIVVLGGGSNVLISDDGIKGLVLHMQYDAFLVAEENKPFVTVTAGAGMQFDSLVAKTVEMGFWGLENLSAIPGSVGAVPVQNVGAYGVEVSNLITTVRAYDTETESVAIYTNEACGFLYRNSFFKTKRGRKHVIIDVTFKLSSEECLKVGYKDLELYFGKRTSLTQKEIRNAVMEIRSHKFPDWKVLGTAGSFFKNPIISNDTFLELKQKYPDLPGFPLNGGEIKVSLSWLLDHVLHVKGVREGNVGMYDAHALVLVNYGNATAVEVETFAKKIQSEVYKKTNIAIEWEVQYMK